MSAENRAVLVVPLRIKEDVIGVLALTDDKVRTFSDEEIGRLQTFADQAALAIRNVQLFSTEQAARAKAATLAERLDILQEIDRAVIAAEAPAAIAVAAALRRLEMLDVPRAIVNIFDWAAGEISGWPRWGGAVCTSARPALSAVVDGRRRRPRSRRDPDAPHRGAHPRARPRPCSPRACPLTARSP